MKSESPHQNHDDITSTKRRPPARTRVFPLISQFFLLLLLLPPLPPPRHNRRRFSIQRSYHSTKLLSFVAITILLRSWSCDGPALKSPVKPLIRSGKIKPLLRWDKFFFSLSTLRWWRINTAVMKKGFCEMVWCKRKRTEMSK